MSPHGDSGSIKKQDNNDTTPPFKNKCIDIARRIFSAGEKKIPQSGTIKNLNRSLSDIGVSEHKKDEVLKKLTSGMDVKDIAYKYLKQWNVAKDPKLIEKLQATQNELRPTGPADASTSKPPEKSVPDDSASKPPEKIDTDASTSKPPEEKSVPDASTSKPPEKSVPDDLPDLEEVSDAE